MGQWFGGKWRSLQTQHPIYYAGSRSSDEFWRDEFPRLQNKCGTHADGYGSLWRPREAPRGDERKEVRKEQRGSFFFPFAARTSISRNETIYFFSDTSRRARAPGGVISMRCLMLLLPITIATDWAKRCLPEAPPPIDLSCAPTKSPTKTPTVSARCPCGAYQQIGACFRCPAGQFNGERDSDSCSHCQSNTYQAQTGQCSCIACPQGRYTIQGSTGATQDSFCHTTLSPSTAPSPSASPFPTPYPTPYPTPFPTLFPTPYPTPYPSLFPTPAQFPACPFRLLQLREKRKTMR